MNRKAVHGDKTSTMAAAGLFAAMITVMTAYICHIPYGANGGYIHFGDALIYLAAVFLPRPYALAAAAIGGGAASDSACMGAGDSDHQNAHRSSVFGKWGKNPYGKELGRAFYRRGAVCGGILCG